ncbi:MAG TPA: hypothetical protein VK590_03660, partial [Saprospiraceae bacterium]|nr:hypothetical protein [Saprospiraceae bacterium]
MFKILIALVPSLIFFLTCYGQNNYIINFDTAGRLKTPLPERINNNDNLSFRINESGENFNIYTDQLKNKIKRALNHIDKLLKDPNGMRLLKDVYDIQVPELNLVRTELNSILFFYNLQLGPPKHFPSFYRMLFFYYLQLGGPKYVPFLSTGNSNYYTVKPVHSTSITPLKFGPNINSASLSTALNSGEKELDFTLTKTDPYKKLLYEWLKKSSSDFVTRPNFLALAQQKKLIETEINSIQDFLALLKKRRDIRPCGFQRVDIQFLITSTTTADRLTQETNKIFTDLLPMLSLEKNKDWILKWLWYQDNNKLPLLNPFPFRTEESFGEEPDTTELSDLRLKIMARNEFYKNMDLKKFSVKQLDSLIDETRLLKRSMSEIQKNSKQYSDKIDKNEKNIRVFGTTSQLLNNGIFYISDIEKKNLWMRHHDASDGYQLINDIETGEYLEDDLIVLLSH